LISGGRLEPFEARLAEVSAVGDAVNLDFVRNVVSKTPLAGGAIVCRTPNSFPLGH